MRQYYQTLCTIGQQHGYYQQPGRPALRLVPTPDTLAGLRRAGLWLKEAADQLHVLRAGEQDAAGPAPLLPAGLLPLRFGLQPLSTYFENFTELPARPAPGGRAICYFRADEPAPVPALAAREALMLPLTPLTLTVPTGTPAAAPASLRLLDLTRRQPRPTALLRDATGLVLTDSRGHAAVDLRPWGGGRYQLLAGEQVLFDFYADDQLYRIPAWGVLEVGSAAALPPQVHLAFAARRTRWQYLLRYQHAGAEKYRTLPHTLSVTATGRTGTGLPSVTFAAVEPVPPGADVAFVSGEALALTEQPGYTCSLRTTHPVPLLVAQLPLPGPELLARPDPAGAATPALSEILVYL